MRSAMEFCKSSNRARLSPEAGRRPLVDGGPQAVTATSSDRRWIVDADEWPGISSAARAPRKRAYSLNARAGNSRHFGPVVTAPSPARYGPCCGAERLPARLVIRGFSVKPPWAWLISALNVSGQRPRVVHDLADLVEYESEDVAQGIREAAILHRARNPDHRLIFICNTPEEVLRVQNVGEAAYFYNKTANSSERIFRPLGGPRIEFDAIYNAQIVPWKRHELSLEIERCAFLFYRNSLLHDAAGPEAAVMARHARAAPGHVFLNPLDEDGASG